MKIALIGYGKMGKAIDQIATNMDVTVVTRINRTSEKSIDQADVCIDFSHPDAFFDHIKWLASKKKPIVVGTTGWYHHMDHIKSIVEKEQIGLIWAENFSLGMNLFLQIVDMASDLINHYPNYDAAISEIHHLQKADSPSGTAIALANVLSKNIRHNEISQENLHISSTRVGKVPGTHSVIFDSDYDTITLTHQARDRTMWAEGALHAAKWIKNKKGMYHITDMLKETHATS